MIEIQMASREDLCICPSFNNYSSDRLAEIAARVAADDDDCPSAAAGNEASGANDDFEFALLRDDQEVSAAEFLYDGPVFPVFNRDLIGSCDQPEPNNLISLSKLFAEEDDERASPPSCSSSEADELENIPVGTYTVWRPRAAPPPLPSQCEKSKSTGSASRRWKLRDLLRRSKSDGNESYVFLTPKHREEKSEKSASPKKGSGKGSHPEAPPPPPSAHETFYVRNRARKEGDKRKSYLPYRRDLVGFFANVSGMRRQRLFT